MATRLIIGSTSGMAEAVARAWALKGDQIILVARSAAKLEVQKSDLVLRGAKSVDVHALDLADETAHQSLVDKIFSTAKVDTVLMAQGVMYTQDDCEQSFKKSMETVNINYLSVMSLCNKMITKFEAQGQGLIAVISSVAGDRGRQTNFIYGASKAAVQCYLSGLRGRLFKSKVQVTDIRPGFVSTALTATMKQGPLFVPAEVAAESIVKAIESKKSVAYVPWFWCWIMLVIRCIPEFIFKRLKI